MEERRGGEKGKEFKDLIEFNNFVLNVIYPTIKKWVRDYFKDVFETVDEFIGFIESEIVESKFISVL